MLRIYRPSQRRREQAALTRHWLRCARESGCHLGLPSMASPLSDPYSDRDGAPFYFSVT